ncbi:sugar MFS transporter [Novosphingobium sp. FSW06-99]|uniref:sugar MFS transporter n=1 Tax=Novosphingobium sp. FSW06-99 TaxID=1739113 RepID=UPI00076D1ED3|nr:sugar MFS transporter [Novosphingobium sp. FSW06-99]KUR80604.1 glucose transporter [Novosphingobium sp. FSW06-99]
MALAPAATSTASPDHDGGHIDAPELRVFVIALFFIFGGITSLNDVIIPKLKELFTLNYTQAMLVQTAFFAAYAIIGIPGAAIVKRVGYMRGAAIGLLTMMAGCILFIPASASATFGLFLAALFVLASGVTIVQVVANPLISLLGPARTAGSRLTFAQAFNSLGTTIFPIAGSILMLGKLAKEKASDLSGAALDAYRVAATQAVVHSYLGIALALAVVAAVVFANRNRLHGEHHDHSSVLKSFDLLLRPRFGFGALCIFLYVGAEVSIGSLIVNYMRQPHVLGLDELAAGALIPLYWFGALVGRFMGSAVMRLVDPAKVLVFNAIGALALIAITTLTTGHLAAGSLLAIGLFNSIMFPTIFTLACDGLDERAADGSGVICVAIVGGAVIPPLTGGLADLTGSLELALLLPALCYAVIAGFGWFARTHPATRQTV